MKIKLEHLQKAVSAAEELGLVEVPWAWLKYIQSGWVIEPTSCSCGGNWAWLKPRPSGAKDMHGCVCHYELDLSKLTDTKLDTISSLTKKALKKVSPTASDIGKIFYTFPGFDTGCIVRRQEFVKLDPEEIGWWVEIGEFDVL